MLIEQLSEARIWLSAKNRPRGIEKQTDQVQLYYTGIYIFPMAMYFQHSLIPLTSPPARAFLVRHANRSVAQDARAMGWVSEATPTLSLVQAWDYFQVRKVHFAAFVRVSRRGNNGKKN